MSPSTRSASLRVRARARLSSARRATSARCGVVAVSLSCALPSLVGCGSDSQPETPAALDFSAFDSAVESFLADNSLSGASLVVVERDAGIVHLKALGDFEPDRVSLIASASKVMSVGVVMQLADQGLLDLDTPVSAYLGDWGEHKTDITLAQMLSNSAGMLGLLDNPTYGPYICQYLDSGTLSDCAKKIYTADDAADRVPPDTQFRYGGGQWQLAGGVAEVVSGKTWAELVNDTYSVPCGLNNTGYRNHYTKGFLGGGVDAALTYPAFFQGDLANLSETDNPSIEGGGYTTAEDYGKFLWMHLRGGVCRQGDQDVRVLSEAAVTRMQQDRIGPAYNGSSLDPNLPGYGLGWWVSRDDASVADPGAYGASPWLDSARGYAAIVILEGAASQGVELREEVKPLLDAMFPLGN